MEEKRKQSQSSPHPIDRHVGMRVRLRRMMLGLSQDKLGEALGLTFQQVQKYEKGVNRIGASRLFEISRILDAPVQYFYDGFTEELPMAVGFAETSREGGSVDDFTELLSTPEGVQLCRAFARISDPKVRRRVVHLIRSLSDEDEGDDKEL